MLIVLYNLLNRLINSFVYLLYYYYILQCVEIEKVYNGINSVKLN